MLYSNVQLSIYLLEHSYIATFPSSQTVFSSAFVDRAGDGGVSESCIPLPILC